MALRARILSCVLFTMTLTTQALAEDAQHPLPAKLDGDAAAAAAGAMAAGDDVLFRPGNAPQVVKQNDPRFNPPQIKDIIAIPGATPGSDKVIVTFSKRPQGQAFRLKIDGHDLLLHDDGLDGDDRAGDGIFTAAVDLTDDDQDEDAPVAAGARKMARPRYTWHLPEKTEAELAFIKVDRTLIITDPGVIADPLRTSDPGAGRLNPNGAWTFGHLIREMVNQPKTGIDPAAFVRHWLDSWQVDQTVNSFAAPARPQMQTIVDSWPKLPDGRLDIDRAPLRLLAITNRIDLAGNLVYGNGSSGEGRFVFAVVNPADNTQALQFTVILEYGIPRHTASARHHWARRWLKLNDFVPGTPEFNRRLERITEIFAGRDAEPSKPNGSALNQLRTDEIAIGLISSPIKPWELREFRLSDSDYDEGGMLEEVTVKQNPDRATYITPGSPGNLALGDWINANAAAVKANLHTVPDRLPATDQPLLGASAVNGGFPSLGTPDSWLFTNVVDREARHQFSLQTCNGCHGKNAETVFTHIKPAAVGQPVLLSKFLTEGPQTVADPAGGAPFIINEILARKRALELFANNKPALTIRFRPRLTVH